MEEQVEEDQLPTIQVRAEHTRVRRKFQEAATGDETKRDWSKLRISADCQKNMFVFRFTGLLNRRH